MIGCSKLLCGQATISEIMRQDPDSKTPAHLLQFSEDKRPIVIWNMTARCNLACIHCYISAEDRSFEGELSTEQGKVLIDDISAMGVPVLLFSGGEPFLREDLFELAAYAGEKGLRTVISSNGTLITPELARKAKEAGIQYVGISLDGGRETHDRFRARKGSFDKAIEGIRHCLDAGLKAGVRLTVNKLNVGELPEIIKVCEEFNIPRFCMYHLVYAGRGKEIVEQDITPEQKRQVLDYLIETSLRWDREGREAEILTTDNHADGIYIKHYLEKHDPERAGLADDLLRRAGGCSAGRQVSNIDPKGNVHACQFWSHVNLGNVKETPFSKIWSEGEHELLKKLRKKEELLSGPRCGSCAHKVLCGGCRIRAEVVNGDTWADDPACYLSEAEIGLVEE